MKYVGADLIVAALLSGVICLALGYSFGFDYEVKQQASYCERLVQRAGNASQACMQAFKDAEADLRDEIDAANEAADAASRQSD